MPGTPPSPSKSVPMPTCSMPMTVGYAGYTSVAVEVGADAYVFDAHDVDHVVEVLYGIQNGGLAVGAQESVVQGYLCYTTLLCQGFHLGVCQVAGVVTEGAGTAVAAYDGLAANLKGIIEAGFGGMAQVRHDAQPVHFLYYLLAEGAESAMFGISLGGIADVIVTVVAKGHIHNAAFSKMFQSAQVLAYRIPVLYS